MALILACTTSTHAGEALKAEMDCHHALYEKFAIGKGPLLPGLAEAFGSIVMISPRYLLNSDDQRQKTGVFVFTGESGYFIRYPREADNTIPKNVNTRIQTNYFKIPSVGYLVVDGELANDDPGLPHSFRAGWLSEKALGDQFTHSDLPPPVSTAEAKRILVLQLQDSLESLKKNESKNLVNYEAVLKKCMKVDALAKNAKSELDRLAKVAHPEGIAEENSAPKGAGNAAPRSKKP